MTRSIRRAGPRWRPCLQGGRRSLVAARRPMAALLLAGGLLVAGTAVALAVPAAAERPEPKRFEGNEPRLISTDADGTLHLPASACEVYGPELEYMPEDRALGYWHQEDDYCVWQLDVARPGRYVVLFEWSCAVDSAGNSFLLTAGESQLKGRVPTSGGWDRHLWAAFGEVDLARGRQELSIRPLPEVRRALMDLRTVRLVPVVESR